MDSAVHQDALETKQYLTRDGKGRAPGRRGPGGQTETEELEVHASACKAVCIWMHSSLCTHSGKHCRQEGELGELRWGKGLPAGGGTWGLAAWACCCSGVSRPAQMLGPSRSRTCPTNSPAAAAVVCCPLVRESKTGAMNNSRYCLNVCMPDSCLLRLLCPLVLRADLPMGHSQLAMIECSVCLDMMHLLAQLQKIYEAM